MKNQIPPLFLRPAASEDRDFRFALFASTRADELARFPGSAEQREVFLRIQFAAQERGYEISFPTAVRSIICLADLPIGSLMVDSTPTEIRVVDIALVPEQRGRGFGGQLLERLKEEAGATGRPLRLRVVKGNPAQRLYQRLGLVIVTDEGLYQQMEWQPRGTRGG